MTRAIRVSWQTVDDDVISELAPRSPLRLLEDLAQLAHGFAAIGRPRPEVELHLAGGSLVKGRLAAVGRGDDRSGPIAVVIVGGSQRAPAAAYVRIDHVAAVTVGDAAIVVRAPVPVPSRLELERQIAVRSEPLAARRRWRGASRRERWRRVLVQSRSAPKQRVRRSSPAAHLIAPRRRQRSPPQRSRRKTAAPSGVRVGRGWCRCSMSLQAGSAPCPS